MDGIIQTVTIFGLLYGISFAAMFYLSHRQGGPLVVPGDIYKVRGGGKIYLPTGGALILAIILFVALKIFAPNF